MIGDCFMPLFNGSGVALVTPFTFENKIDYHQLGELIEWHISKKTDAIIVCGTTGESSTLEDSERVEIIRYSVEKAAQRIPIIAGTGTNSTAHSIALSQLAETAGADGVICVTPYYNKTTQNGLIRHFSAIADAINIPLILYSVPERTGINIEPKTVYELSKHPMISGIKEAGRNIAQVLEMVRLVSPDFKIYAGNDDMILPVLSLGGHGVISVLANIMPTETHEMVYAYLNHDLKSALKYQIESKILIDALFCEVNPIPVKAALSLMGMTSHYLRAPLYDMEEVNKTRLISELKIHGLV